MRIRKNVLQPPWTRLESSKFWANYAFSSGGGVSSGKTLAVIDGASSADDTSHRPPHPPSVSQCRRLKTESRISELLSALTYSGLRKHIEARRSRRRESAERGQRQAMMVLCNPRKPFGQRQC